MRLLRASRCPAAAAAWRGPPAAPRRALSVLNYFSRLGRRVHESKVRDKQSLESTAVAHLESHQRGEPAAGGRSALSASADGGALRLDRVSMNATVLSAPGRVALSAGSAVSGYVSCGALAVQGADNAVGGVLVREALELAAGAELDVGAGVHAPLVRLGAGSELEVGLALEAGRVEGAARRLHVRGPLQASEAVDVTLSGGSSVTALAAPLVRVRALHESMSLKDSLRSLRLPRHGGLTADVVVGDTVDLEDATVIRVRGRHVRVGPGVSALEVTYAETIEVHPEAKVEHAQKDPRVALELTEEEAEHFSSEAEAGAKGGGARDGEAKQ